MNAMSNGGAPEARDHHFVPRFILRPWATNGLLKGYCWDPRRNALRYKLKGPSGFCAQLDLLSLSAHDLGRDAIERIFFGDVDTKGAQVRDRLLDIGSDALSPEQRIEFARLLMSLDARRPENVATLRALGHQNLASGLDTDPQILAAMAARGIQGAPSQYAEEQLGFRLADRALALVQGVVDNREVGTVLINAHWSIARVAPNDGSFILSDRPLIRIYGYKHPKATWVLPLTPSCVFIASRAAGVLKKCLRAMPATLAKRTNQSSARQAEKYIFAIGTEHETWIGPHLRRAAAH